MSVRLFGSLSLTLGFVLACTGGTTEAPPPPPAAPPPAEVAAPVAATGDIGVPECDDYMAKMTACLAQMDPAVKAATESGFKQTTDAWRAAAATPAGKAGLAMGCKAAVDAIPASCGTGATATATTPGGTVMAPGGGATVAGPHGAVTATGAAASATGPAGTVEVKTTEPAVVEHDADHTQGKAFSPRPGQGADDKKDKKGKKKKD